MDALAELAVLLKPAAGGVYLVSTGRREQEELQRRYYGASGDAEVETRFRENLGLIREARVVLLAIPSDVGASYLRGANMGPQAVRAALMDEIPDWPARARACGVVDIGDVLVVPQFLSDEMLAAEQLRATRAAIYPGLAAEEAALLPVSPLSIAERALDLILAINPAVVPVILGGDHSVAWPVAKALHHARHEPWGIVQVDAHTDLLRDRLGVRYCYATWAHHANELVGRGGRLVQVGIRASRADRAHWEASLGVRQFWADECRARPAAALDELVAHLAAAGVRSVYFSNDIDGTDAAHADATGTPEPGGLDPDFVVELIRRLGRQVGLCAGDVVELAPHLARSPEGSARTTRLAVRYLRETLAAIVGQPV